MEVSNHFRVTKNENKQYLHHINDHSLENANIIGKVRNLTTFPTFPTTFNFIIKFQIFLFAEIGGDRKKLFEIRVNKKVED